MATKVSPEQQSTAATDVALPAWSEDELAQIEAFANGHMLEHLRRAASSQPNGGIGHNSGARPSAKAPETATVFQQFEAIVDSAGYSAEQKCILVKIPCRVNAKTMDGAIVSNEGLMRAASLKDPRALRAELRDLQGKTKDLPEERDTRGRPIYDPIDASRATITLEERRGRANIIGFTPERLHAIVAAYLQYREQKRGHGRPPASDAPPLSGKPPASGSGGLGEKPPGSGSGGFKKPPASDAPPLSEKPPASHAENPLRQTHPDPSPLSKRKKCTAAPTGAAHATEPSADADHHLTDDGARTTRKRAAPRTRIRPDWRPTEEMIAWVKEGWLATDQQIAAQADRFRDYHTSKGSLMADWPAAWRTWWRNDFHKIARRPAESKPDAGADLDAAYEQMRREREGWQ